MANKDDLNKEYSLNDEIDDKVAKLSNLIGNINCDGNKSYKRVILHRMISEIIDNIKY